MTDQQNTQSSGTERRATPAPDRHPEASQSSEEVLRILKKAAYLNIFSIPDPGQPPIGYPLIPFFPASIYQIEVIEAPHRLQVSVEPPSAECGFRTRKTISRQSVAKLHLLMQVIHNNYQPGPGRNPPPTVLNPFISQRFSLNNGHLEFLDGEGSAFLGHAAGRFFPATVAGVRQLRITGVVDFTQGLGRLGGIIGNAAINGYTIPPEQFALNLLLRLVDTDGKLASAAPLPPVEPVQPDPDPDTAFIPLMAEMDPDYPVVIEPMSDGKKKKIRLVERLRLVDTSFDVGPGSIKSSTVEGEVVGEHRTTLVFDPEDSQQVIPMFSTGSVFRFFASGNRPIGSLKADLFEGRAFRTFVPELKQPFFRIAGFGPFLEGTGQFKDLVGMVSLNGALSLTPVALSAMYMLRISDPLSRFRTL